MSEEMILPPEYNELTPGQVIKLGGIFCFEIIPLTGKGRPEKIARYKVAKYVWIDPCKKKDVPTVKYDNFLDIFTVEEVGAMDLTVVPKLSMLDKFTVVPVMPSVFTSLVKYAIFIKPVPKSLYEEVLREGEEIDKKFDQCTKKKRPRAGELKIKTELSETSVELLRSALEDVIRDLMAEQMRVLLEIIKGEEKGPLTIKEHELESLRKRVEAERQIKNIPHVYRVTWSNNEMEVICLPKVIDVVAGKIRELGGKVLDTKEISRKLMKIVAEF